MALPSDIMYARGITLAEYNGADTQNGSGILVRYPNGYTIPTSPQTDVTAAPVGTSQQNATSGTGTSVDLLKPRNILAMAVTSTNTLISTSSVILEGSLDNVNWFFIGKTGTITLDLATSRTRQYTFVNTNLARYLRTVIGTELGLITTVVGSISGGTITTKVTGS